VFGSLDRYEKASKLNAQDFKQLFGVKKETFDTMIKVLTVAYAAKHTRRGRHAKLSLQDQLFLSLKYWRQYVTQKELSYEFEVGEATTRDTIVWVENTLVKSGKFHLPGKKALYGEDTELEVVLVDVTESPVERPKKSKVGTIVRKRKSTPKKRS
jgi:hypothetical protein